MPCTLIGYSCVDRNWTGDLFIGFHVAGNSWKWLDGSTVSYTNWQGNVEPDVSRGHCTLMKETGQWSPSKCGQQLYYACKAKQVRKAVVLELPAPLLFTLCIQLPLHLYSAKLWSSHRWMWQLMQYLTLSRTRMSLQHLVPKHSCRSESPERSRETLTTWGWQPGPSNPKSPHHSIQRPTQRRGRPGVIWLLQGATMVTMAHRPSP